MGRCEPVVDRPVRLHAIRAGHGAATNFLDLAGVDWQDIVKGSACDRTASSAGW
jgi:hypothetical protein